MISEISCEIILVAVLLDGLIIPSIGILKSCRGKACKLLFTLMGNLSWFAIMLVHGLSIGTLPIHEWGS